MTEGERKKFTLMAYAACLCAMIQRLHGRCWSPR